MLCKISFSVCLVITQFAVIFYSFMNRFHVLCQISFYVCPIVAKFAIIFYNSFILCNIIFSCCFTIFICFFNLIIYSDCLVFYIYIIDVNVILVYIFIHKIIFTLLIQNPIHSFIITICFYLTIHNQHWIYFYLDIGIILFTFIINFTFDEISSLVF